MSSSPPNLSRNGDVSPDLLAKLAQLKWTLDDLRTALPPQLQTAHEIRDLLGILQMGMDALSIGCTPPPGSSRAIIFEEMQTAIHRANEVIDVIRR